MSYLLDTCVLSELVKPQPTDSVISWLQAHHDAELFIGVLTIGELERGVALLPHSEKRRALADWLDALVNQFQSQILPFDLGAAQRWGVLTAAARQAGRTLALADSLIAATAVTHNLSVVTRNVKDFEAAQVGLVNPWEE